MADEVSRRGLIGLGIGGVVAALAESGSTAQTAQAAGRKLGFAVVGLGKLSLGQIVPGFRNCRSARLAALVTGHPDKGRRIAAEQGLPESAVYTYDDYDRIAADPSIDIVYVVLPNFMHAEYTIRALKAGKHVLCEKPMATDVADAEKMVAAATAAKRELMIAYRCHYEPHNLEAMKRIRSGRYGKARLVVTDMVRQSDLSEPSDAWRLDMVKSGGGALADMGIYGINGARYLIGEEPLEVRAWANTDRSDPRFGTVEDLIAWQFRFPSGAIANGSTSFATGGAMMWDVHLARARLRGDPGCYYSGNHLNVFSHPDEGEVKLPDIDQFAREMDWMAEAAQGKVPLVSPGEEGVQDMRLIEAILASVAKGGAPVKTDWGYKRAYDPALVVPVMPASA